MINQTACGLCENGKNLAERCAHVICHYIPLVKICPECCLYMLHDRGALQKLLFNSIPNQRLYYAHAFITPFGRFLFSLFFCWLSLSCVFFGLLRVGAGFNNISLDKNSQNNYWTDKHICPVFIEALH